MSVKKTKNRESKEAMPSPRSAGSKSRKTQKESGEKTALGTFENKKGAVGLKTEVYDTEGKVIESIDLPGEIFGVKPNDSLVSQAVRVYLANKRRGTVSTRTRGEVKGSTRKIYKQKGTGRARHGSKKAPIFVHGGVVFGPKPKDYSLALSKNMSRLALFTVLSQKLRENKIKIVGNLDKVNPKTKEAAKVFEALGFGPKNRQVLFVAPFSLRKNLENVYRALRNLGGVEILEARMLNALNVLRGREIVFMRDALSVLDKTFLKRD
ncbi:50S ribosomal protein L4 [Patescibacteria group bacterium]|nr:50S ribosomal protein L4 [Patescibacteria group bacterium]MCL5010570.1 50S ribosomal protein L4 [Patescibacteria group bacterium]